MAQQPRTSGTPEKEKSEAGTVTTTTTSNTDEMTPENRDELANRLVDRFAMWSGVGGIIPIPVVDLLAVGGLQLQMLRRLSQIYNVPFSENRGKALIASLTGSTVPATSALGAGTILKAIPVVGTAISMFVMPVLSAGATYAIGKVFIQHFTSGGTLLDFNPPDYRKFIEAHKEMWENRRTNRASKTSSSGNTDTTAKATATSS
jgi:uncharacterized protein (DUF697 family)